MKTIVERGASWGLEETKLLLSFWGQDMVQRQTTNLKRTKEVYEKISEQLCKHNYERTAEQVRTRVFNMIAEYRRIKKDPNPERSKKCLFFDALHKIYQAKGMDDVKSALDDYEPDASLCSPTSTIEDKGDDSMAAHEQNISTSVAETVIDLPANNDVSKNSANNDNIQQQHLHQQGTEINAQGPHHQQTISQTNNPPVVLDSSNQQESMVNNVKKTYSSLTPVTNTNNNSATVISKQLAAQNMPNTNGGAPPTTTTQAFITGHTSLQASNVGAQQRQQSLLLPNASTSQNVNSTSTTSTPLTKLNNATGANTPSYISINSGKGPTLYRTNQLIGHPTGQTNGNDSTTANGPRLQPATATITSHQLYHAPVNTFDVTSSALLIDRVFAHLARGEENMREWISLEKERLAMEKIRRQHDAERDMNRERILIETLSKLQEKMFDELSKLQEQMFQEIPKIITTLHASFTPSNSSTTQAPTSSSSSLAVPRQQPEMDVDGPPEDQQEQQQHQPQTQQQQLPEKQSETEQATNPPFVDPKSEL